MMPQPIRAKVERYLSGRWPSEVTVVEVISNVSFRRGTRAAEIRAALGALAAEGLAEADPRPCRVSPSRTTVYYRAAGDLVPASARKGVAP